MNSLKRSDSDDVRLEADVMLAAGSVLFRRDFWQSPTLARSEASGLPVLWSSGLPYRVPERRGRSVQLAIKRGFDIVVALLAILVLMPLLIAVGLTIKLSSRGPILFRQKREGLNGRLFEALKFRSMRVEDADPTGVKQTLRDDPRVTVIGRFIRSTSIDELPQLLNVIRGDMSLVGPRPHVPGMHAAGVPYRSLVSYYDDRLAMVPGITGWAQANGYRGMTDDAASAISRIDHDIAYVQNFSLWLDVQILVKTVVREFVTGSGH